MNKTLQRYTKKEIKIRKLKKSVSLILSEQFSSFKLAGIHKQYNSINGIFFNNNRKFFFKVLLKKQATTEVTGYNKLKLYPVPELCCIINTTKYSILIYKYENTVGSDKGLLIDFINQNFSLNKQGNNIINEILNIWHENFMKTTKWSNGGSPNDNLFKKRIATDGRYDLWYNSKNMTKKRKNSLKKLSAYKFIINNKKYKKTINVMHKEVKKEPLYARKRFRVVSQGDPLETNIGTKPVFFDFENAGLNDFIGETAVFIWGTLIDGGYFSPKYHVQAYWLHRKTLRNIKKHKYLYLNYVTDHTAKEIKIDYNLKIPLIRRYILENYLKKVVKPILKIANLDMKDYFKRIKSYMFMRIMCVHNLVNMSEGDVMFSLALLADIYEGGLEEQFSKWGIKL